MKRESERNTQPIPELISEVILSVLLIGLAVYAIIDAVHIGSAIAREPVGPAFLPRVLGIGLIALGAPLLGRSAVRLIAEGAPKESQKRLLSSGTPNGEGLGTPETSRNSLLSKPGFLFFTTMALSALYVILLQYRILWFPIATVTFLTALGGVIMLKEGVKTTARQLALLLLVSAALSVFLEAMFRHGLRLRLP